MDHSRRNPPQNTVSTRQHLVDTSLFLVVLVFAWVVTFTFRRQIQNPNYHCAVIIGIIIAVSTNPRHVHEISDFAGELVEAFLPLMILGLLYEMDRASRRSILPATSTQQNQETNH